MGADPPVAIGQRSLLVATQAGNVLWDPSGFVDDAAVATVRAAGRIGRYLPVDFRIATTQTSHKNS